MGAGIAETEIRQSANRVAGGSIIMKVTTNYSWESSSFVKSFRERHDEGHYIHLLRHNQGDTIKGGLPTPR